MRHKNAMKLVGKRHFELYIGLATLALLTAAAGLAYFQPFSPHGVRVRNPALDLRASEVPGRVRVDWNPQDEGVRTAQNGTLEVVDGGLRNRYPVEQQVLRSGSFDYIRKSEDVFLTLTLFRNGQPDRQGVIRTIGPVRPIPAETLATTPPRERTGTRARRR